jgi:peptidylprolyl isomerase domain and WD repeat-containing protein 1
MKNRTLPCRLTISPRGDFFAITCTDRKIRLFDFLTGKLKKIYNESSEVYAPVPSSSNGSSNSMAASLGGGKYLSEQDMGRRRATEREFESDEKSLKEWNAVFDESGNFLVSLYFLLIFLTRLACRSLEL